MIVVGAVSTLDQRRSGRIDRHYRRLCGSPAEMTRVTNHAARRTKERLGLPKKLSHKNAENALRYGIRHSDTSGSLNRYISALYWKHETANNVRIYCNNVYIFHGETLITIFPLPQKYRKTAARISRKTTERGEFDENS